MSIGELFTLASRGRIERAVAQRAVENPQERERALARQAAGRQVQREVREALEAGAHAQPAPSRDHDGSSGQPTRKAPARRARRAE